MADKEFKSVGGFVQFPVEEREANGQTVRDLTIRSFGSEGARIRITLWPEHADVDVEQGDVVFVDGPFEARTGQSQSGEERVYLNMSAREIAVLKPEERVEKAVVKKGAKKASKSSRAF